MSTMKGYSYTVLRYVHDIVTGEFVNVGVALYCPEARYASAICRPTIGRVSKVFPDMNREYFKSLMRHIQARFEELGDRWSVELPLESPLSIDSLARSVLPADDSSLQWSPAGHGLSADPAATLDSLFERFVTRYEDVTNREHRNNDDVWRSFRHALESRQILHYFGPHRIAVEDDAIDFEYSWQNGILHCLEPLSFDLADPDSIRDKAHRWLGRITSIAESSAAFRIYFLVGRPRNETLQDAYRSAISILRKIPGQQEIFPEQDAEKLADRIGQELEEHPAT
jgi:hypothetical protein